MLVVETTEINTVTPPSADVIKSISGVQRPGLNEDIRDVKRRKDAVGISQKNPDKRKTEGNKVAYEIADAMNGVVKALNTHLTFSVHQNTGKTVVKVVDSESGEVRRQIPPEEVLELIDKMRTLVGLLFHEEA